MLDRDHFKAFNDAFGHAAGDAALREVAEILRSTLRHGDFVARYAGEEFVLILPATDTEAAMMVAERVRAAVAGLYENPPFWVRGSMTASIGVAPYPVHGRSADQLLKAADDAMHTAKPRLQRAVGVATDHAMEGIAG